MIDLTCSGPGPHQPAGGVLGQGDQPITGLYCPAAACQAAAQTAGQAAQAEAANRVTIQQQAIGALTTNRNYLAIQGAPTNAQVVAQVQALTVQNVKIIRLLLGQTADGTN